MSDPTADIFIQFDGPTGLNLDLIEDALEVELGDLGEVVGTGSGEGGNNVDVRLLGDREQGMARVRAALFQLGLLARAEIRAVPNVREPPDWFWGLLDRTRPSLVALSRELEALPRARLIEYARLYFDAASEVCKFWNGPEVDGLEFSEDDTEDLCEWIVSRGREYWRSAVALCGHLEPIVREYWEEEASTRPPSWSSDVDVADYEGQQSPRLIAYAVFEVRFGASLFDLLLDEQDEES